MYLFLAVLGLCYYSGFSLVVVHGLLIGVTSCCGAQALGPAGFNSRGSGALEHRLSTCGPQALVALWHVRSSWARDWTRVSCVGRWVLYHWAAREALCVFFNADTYRQKNIHIFGSAHVPHIRNLSVGNFNLIWGKPRIEEILLDSFREESSDDVVLGWYSFPCFPCLKLVSVFITLCRSHICPLGSFRGGFRNSYNWRWNLIDCWLSSMFSQMLLMRPSDLDFDS